MRFLAAAASIAVLVQIIGAVAREYPIGGPVHEHDMEIAASYLVDVEMAPMPPGMPMGPDTVHLETDVHATADNVWGFSDGAWIPYLTIDYTLTKQGTDWQATGHMLAMTAKDGPHYANNVKMNGSGTYKVVLRYGSPEANSFLHHVDKETGVPGFWQPFSETFTFTYPQR
jgi:uncharacterized protein involved in high-affinity Fe2+ transport